MRIETAWLVDTDAVLGAEKLWISGSNLLFADSATGHKFARLFCLSVKDGSVIWCQCLPEPGRATVGCLVAGLVLFFRSDETEGHVRAYAIESGELVWEHKEMHSGGAMLVLGSNVVMDLWSEGREAIALIDGRTGELIWQVPTQVVRWPRSRAQCLLFEIQDDQGERCGVVAARDIGNGSERWSVDLQQEGDYWDIVTRANQRGFVVDVVAAEGLVHCTVKQGALVTLNAANGDVVWKRKFDGGTPQRPVVRNGKLYTTTHARFHCLDAATGATILEESAEIGALPFGLGCVDGSYYYCSTGNGLRAFDVRTGRETWRYEAEEAFGSPIAFDGRIYASTMSGRVYCFEIE